MALMRAILYNNKYNHFPVYLIFQYSSIFRRGDAHSIPSSIQGAASITSAASLDNSLSDMYRSPPRPLPYDAEPRYFRSQRDGLVSRREKGSSHSNEETEPLRSNADVDPESLNSGDKWKESACEAGSKEYRSKSSLRLQSTKYSTGVGLVYASSEEEDVCPTCLEGRDIYFYLNNLKFSVEDPLIPGHKFSGSIDLLLYYA